MNVGCSPFASIDCFWATALDYAAANLTYIRSYSRRVSEIQQGAIVDATGVNEPTFGLALATFYWISSRSHCSPARKVERFREASFVASP
ncbi:hypothetical protein TWF569_002561 [Orbilia oligospora]|uniref:Uncharacterized protein n=1 Tax=Orbilia oligospora TaxID=2813651 RepID=A0A7C8NI65_ORBOL|nr:hypothetical protein TWF102_004375 [Orbilia oligospora]KAF3110443.1 hypothetical protein TWF103_004713 [Orbilia oligospora]KAF3121514.1 hypothetical protein TWF569_002561 [Orbilia oligospora]KAF3123336.1 hypothetical protein TWF594_002452 [Orbilia oligospora]